MGKEAHVYKYADRQNIFFDCQITLNIKEPGQQYCDVPECPDPPRRRRRNLNKRENELNKNKTNNDDFLITRDDLIKQKNWIEENFVVDKVNICKFILCVRFLVIEI